MREKVLITDVTGQDGCQVRHRICSCKGKNQFGRIFGEKYCKITLSQEQLNSPILLINQNVLNAELVLTTAHLKQLL